MKTITLANLSDCTAQEVADFVATHLLRQGRRSTVQRRLKEMCAYRGDMGTKCAAGCLIANDEYNSSIEGELWRSLSHAHAVPHAHCNLIEALQNVHDEVDPGNWRSALCDVYLGFGLDAAVLDAETIR